MRVRNTQRYVVALIACLIVCGCSHSETTGVGTSAVFDAELVDSRDIESEQYLAKNPPTQEELAMVRECVGERSGIPMPPPPADDRPAPQMTATQTAAFFPCVWSLGLQNKFVAPKDHEFVEAIFGVAERLLAESRCMEELGWDVVVEEDGFTWGIGSAPEGDPSVIEADLAQDLASCGVEQGVSEGLNK